MTNKLITIVLTTLLVVFGCSSMPNRSPGPQRVVIEVQGAENVVVDKQEYAPSDNPALRNTQLTHLNQEHTIAYTKIFSGLSVSDVTRLWQDIEWLNDIGVKKVMMFINSPGGDAFSGLALADLIERAQKEYGMEFEANANGIIASAAVPVFAVCKRRIAARGTIFMVHEAALWKWPGRETASDIRSQNDLMILLQDRYLNYLTRHSTLTLDEWRAKEKATTWFSAEQGLEWGLVDEVK